MTSQRRIYPGEQPEPDVYFLPLALPEPRKFRDIDPGVISRRVPDFLHQMINQGEAGPTGMLEIQTPPTAGGKVQWVVLDAPPDPGEAFAMLPAEEEVRAVVTGSMGVTHDGMELELNVHLREDLNSGVTTNLQLAVDARDPVPALAKMAARLASILDIPFHEPPPGLLTHSGMAFYKFLEGLDGSALLSGDLQVDTGSDPESLMRPYTEALSLDPNFGLALRVAHVSLATALENSRIGPASCYRIIDQCLDVGPVDGEGCVQMAAHLAVLGDDERAKRWLEHATHLNPPPPRGLESLGILMARRGKYVEARDLWLQGVGLDGHPDFFAHLARLAFNEGNLNEAWDKVLRGLRRMYERMVRSEEWVDDGQGLGLLLQYMVEHLESQKAPEEVIEALRDLSGLLVDPEDRVDLGLCLQRVGVDDLARVEIEAALSADAIDLGTRDKGVRALLVLDVPDFERRFARAADTANTSRNPARGMREMREFITRQPEFWPALFFLAMGLKRQEHADEALDSLQEVLQIRPGQVETLCEMGELFAARGNPKRALECVEEALLERSEDPRLHARRAEYLEKLDRKEEAREAFERAVELDRAEGPDDGEGRPEAEK